MRKSCLFSALGDNPINIIYIRKVRHFDFEFFCFCLQEAFDANLPTENNAGAKVNDRDNKRQLMKHMGQLWLAAEVRDLESRVKGKMSLSPYLVVDVEALIKHMDMVKQLVYSRKFLILVPTTGNIF